MSASEISLETSLPTLPVGQQRYTLGGAGNVAANLKAMGVGMVRSFGVTGDDPFGWQMRRIMAEAGIIDDQLLVQNQSWQRQLAERELVILKLQKQVSDLISIPTELELFFNKDRVGSDDVLRERDAVAMEKRKLQRRREELIIREAELSSKKLEDVTHGNDLLLQKKTASFMHGEA